MLVLEQCGRRLTGAGLIGHLAATYILAEDDHPLLESSPRASSGPRSCGAPEFQLDLAGADWLVTRRRGDRSRSGDGRADHPVRRLAAARARRSRGADRAGAERGLARHPGTARRRRARRRRGDARDVGHLRQGAARVRPPDRLLPGDQAADRRDPPPCRHDAQSVFYAGYAADAAPEELPLAASAARFAAEEAADYATRTCIAVHGGIGATWEHDAHLYWRRAQLSRLLLGGVAGAGDRVAEEIIATSKRNGNGACMSTTSPTFSTDAIGQWSDPVEFAVTRERIQQYAAATNDPIEPHAQRRFRLAGVRGRAVVPGARARRR